MPNTNSPEMILADALLQNRSPVGPRSRAGDCDIAHILDCIVHSCQNVFLTTCNVELNEPTISSGCAVGRLEMSGVVGISGAKNLTVAVNLSELFCRCAYEAMTADQCASNEDLHDALGELANQLVGSAKEMLQVEDLQLGLPTIVWGAGHHIAFAADMEQHVVRFNGVDGLRIEVGIAVS